MHLASTVMVKQSGNKVWGNWYTKLIFCLLNGIFNVNNIFYHKKKKALTDTPRNYVLPTIWGSLRPFRLTHEINHRDQPMAVCDLFVHWEPGIENTINSYKSILKKHRQPNKNGQRTLTGISQKKDVSWPIHVWEGDQSY